MLPQNNPDRIRIVFDDHRLVANAGLLLSATLAQHLGLRELVDRHLDLGGAPGRANTGDKLLTLVASALAGGDCIDDADALRAGGTARVLGCMVKAPSTLGTFLPKLPADRSPFARSASADGRAGGLSPTSVISRPEERKQPVFKAASSSVSGVVSQPAALQARSRSKAERMEYCQSVLAPSNSGVEGHRAVRVLDDVRGGRSAGQELHPHHAGAVTGRAFVQRLQGRRGVAVGIAAGMTAVAVAPADGAIAAPDCGGQVAAIDFAISEPRPEDRRNVRRYGLRICVALKP